MDKQKSVGRPKKPATKKPATKKVTTKKPATKKVTTKKPATKKVTTKKPATKKPATKKPATKKVTTKKPATKKVTTKKPATKKASSKSKKGFLGFVKEMFSMNGGGDGHCPEGMVENLDTGAMEPFEMNGGRLGFPYRRGQHFRPVLENVKENNNNNNNNNNNVPPRNSLKNKVLNILKNNENERGKIDRVTNNSRLIRYYYTYQPTKTTFEVKFKNGEITNVIEQNNGKIALPRRITRNNNNKNKNNRPKIPKIKTSFGNEIKKPNLGITIDSLYPKINKKKLEITFDSLLGPKITKNKKPTN